MNEHRDDLSTADLAGPQPTDTARTEREREADLEREDVDTDRSGDRGAASDDRPRDAADDQDRDLEGGRDRLLTDDRNVAAGTADERTADSAPGPVGGAPAYPAPGSGAPGPVGDSTAYPAPASGAPAPVGASTVDPTPDTRATMSAPTTGPLLPSAEAERFRARWTDVQTGFVDSPRQAVQRADRLTAELMQHLAKTFADERSDLERQWDRGDDVPTDELRTAFQRYRSFFERLLAT